MNHKFVLLILLMIIVNVISAQSNGILQVSTTTKSAGGNYAPNNIVAVWIENDNGQFVKTLAAYANKRKAYLDTWGTSTSKAGSTYNIVDAVTGATRPSHGTITCSWNGTDFKGNAVNDGTYKLRFELTDKHSTGNLASIPFSKGSVLQELSPANVPSFESNSVRWVPSSVNVVESKNQQKELKINYDPSSGQLSVSGVSVKKMEIYNSAGKLIKTYSASTANLNNLSTGIYLIVVNTDAKIYCQKFMKAER